MISERKANHPRNERFGMRRSAQRILGQRGFDCHACKRRDWKERINTGIGLLGAQGSLRINICCRIMGRCLKMDSGWIVGSNGIEAEAVVGKKDSNNRAMYSQD